MDKVLLEKKNGMGIVTLNEPEKMNGLSIALGDALLDVLDICEKDDEIKVIVITGKGNIFSAGGDISVFDQGVADGSKYIEYLVKVFGKIEKGPKPIISAVNGFALGGGTELTLASDIVIASEEAKFGFPEVGIGIIPGFAIIRLHQVVGRTKAKELILTGKQIDAKEAERIGIVSRVVPKDQLMATVEEEAKLLMSRAPLSLKAAKSIINREIGGEEYISSVHATSLMFGLDDLKEGRNAFFEKRKPEFKGR